MRHTIQNLLLPLDPVGNVLGDHLPRLRDLWPVARIQMRRVEGGHLLQRGHVSGGVFDDDGRTPHDVVTCEQVLTQ